MPPKFKNIPRPKAVKKKPASSLTIQFKEALALHQQGKLAEAKNIYLKILAIQPDYFDPLHLLGVIARQNGDAAKAVELISKAIQINPNSPFSYNNLGNAYKDQGKLDQAFSSYDKALALKWDYPEAHYSRADILKKLNKLKEAIAGYDEAIAYKPDYPDAIVDRGNAFMELKQIDAALRDYKKAAELGFGFMLGVWLFFRMSTCDWSDANSQISALVDQVNAGKNVCTAFASLGFIDSLAVQRKTADVWVKTKRPANYSLGPINQYPHHQKIRIAYYSMDFRNHPVAFLTAELFELHDRSRFEIIAFSFGKPSDDPMRQRLKVAFDQFIEVEDKTDLEIAQLSRSMEVDIAIDLAGHTKDSRAGIFACRAAPIQVNYLGYPGTMSAEYIDYIIADKTLIPPHSQHHYSEKIVYLPCYQANDRKRPIDQKGFTRAELGLPETGFVFCCFSNSYKFNPSTFDSWIRIIKAVEGSVLFLYADNDLVIQNLHKEASDRGVSPQRIIFGKRLSQPLYLARYQATDLFLDTAPFNAGTTASDALWTGLPVLTRMGESFASRMAASLLTAIGLTELITTSPEDYEALAIELATNSQKLAAIKEKLSDNRLTAPLFNTPLFTKNIEAAYTQMYQRYQADLTPHTIELQ